MSDILGNRELSEIVAELNEHSSLVNEIITSHRALQAERDTLQARVAALEAALRDLYDATTPVERQIGVATEDWHHVLFEASGTAHSVLAASHQPDSEEA